MQLRTLCLFALLPASSFSIALKTDDIIDVNNDHSATKNCTLENNPQLSHSVCVDSKTKGSVLDHSVVKAATIFVRNSERNTECFLG